MEKQIFITMDGGLIQDIDISPDLADIQITVLDFDTEGIPIEDLSKTPRGEDVLISDYVHNTIEDKDLEFWEEILARKNLP